MFSIRSILGGGHRLGNWHCPSCLSTQTIGLEPQSVFRVLAVTTVAFALGHAIGDSAPVPQVLPWSALGLGLVSGMIVGGLQCLVLRHHAAGASQWVWRSTIGFGVGLSLIGVATMFLLNENRLSVFGWHTVIDLLILIALDGMFIGGIWAALTGSVIFMRKAEMDEV